MRLAMVAARFDDIEANGLRKAMATFRNDGTIGRYEEKMVERMVARGYERDFAQRCFDQIKGFGSYGFPESHAASFAKLVYISSYLKKHHPAAFACALLNSQPMGFYAPAQIVREAQENGGVEPRPIDVNASAWDNGLEALEAGIDGSAERGAGNPLRGGEGRVRVGRWRVWRTVSPNSENTALILRSRGAASRRMLQMVLEPLRASFEARLWRSSG